MSETVAVIGAGMAGLAVALALAPTGRRVILIERDPPPPAGGPEAAFADWRRRGVGQLRQSHAFLARLRLALIAEHPALRDALLAAGARELTFEALLTKVQRPRFRPREDDDDLTLLTSRRTTFEWVLRAYVERLPPVSIRAGVFVRDLILEPGPAAGAPAVAGLRLDGPDGPEDLRADIVVDAGGGMGIGVDRLRAAGAHIDEESEPAGILYFTRHYRLKAGSEEPPRESRPPGAGDLGYLKFGVFPGDNRCFSVTLSVPEIEEGLRTAIVRPNVWDAVCATLPGVAGWIDPARATPTTHVLGAGNLESRWRDHAPVGRPAALGYFAVGDSLIRTNPLYGRGCAFAIVEAGLLREALDGSADSIERALSYQAAVRRELRPFYEAMRDQDRSAIRRAARLAAPPRPPSLRRRLVKSFAEDGVAVAVRTDVDLMRQAMRGFHMLEAPNAWLKRPANLARILAIWARGRRRNAAAYPPELGPDRATMIEILRRGDLLAGMVVEPGRPGTASLGETPRLHVYAASRPTIGS